MILGTVDLCIRYLTLFSDRVEDRSFMTAGIRLLLLVIMLCAAFLQLKLYLKISEDAFIKLVLSALCIAYPAASLSGLGWNNGGTLAGFQMVFCIMAVAALRFAPWSFESRRAEAMLHSAVLVFCIFPFLLSAFIETVHVLNQNGVFVVHLRKWFACAVLLSLFPFAGSFQHFLRKGIPEKDWKTWAAGWIVFGTACLAVQVPLQDIYDAHLFETANYSVLITDFLETGKLPLISHYGGHMLTGVPQGILYGFLNGDLTGAAFNPYLWAGIPFLVLLFFLFVKRIAGPEEGLLAVLTFPFLYFWYYYGYGMLAAAAFLAFVKKKTLLRALMLWGSVVFCALVRLDIGFCLVLVCSGMILLLAADERSKRVILLNLAGTGIWAAAGIGLWCALCMMQGTDAPGRLKEFLLISLSNQNWARETIGDMGKAPFVWFYCILPFSAAVCLFFAVCSGNVRRKIGDEQWFLLIFWGLFYFGNITRGLVRHTVQESFLVVVVWNAYLFLAYAAEAFSPRKHLFIPCMAVLITVHCFIRSNTGVFTVPEECFIAGFKNTADTVSDIAAETTGSFVDLWVPGKVKTVPGSGELPEGKTVWDDYAEHRTRVNRVVPGQETRSALEPMRLVTEQLLADDETYVDFMNYSFSYSYTGKPDPAYISQSPLQLSGEYAQERFIEEIRGVPVVFMPAAENRNKGALDGISNNIRYYKVAEYIYEHYEPLCLYNNEFAVWCLKERKREFSGRMQSLYSHYDLLARMTGNDSFVLKDCTLVPLEDGSIEMTAAGPDPGIRELEQLLPAELREAGAGGSIRIVCESKDPGYLQLYYTTEAGESFSNEKTVVSNVEGRCLAEFEPELNENSRLRLDFNEKGRIILKEFCLQSGWIPCDYGYDGPVTEKDGEPVRFINGFHEYDLRWLPRIWADKDPAAGNLKLCSLISENGVFVFSDDKSTGAGRELYLLLDLDVAESPESHKDPARIPKAEIRAGNGSSGTFDEKCRFYMNLESGKHKYIIRVSSDYYWYTGQIDTVSLASPDTGIINAEISLLEGD